MIEILGSDSIRPRSRSSIKPLPNAELLPRLPPGTITCWGTCQSNCSINSNATDFCPSNRYGLSEFSRYAENLRTTSCSTFKQPSKSVRSCKTCAPYSRACASFPAATCPAGKRTMLFISARAAYAATEAEVFPVEAQHTQENPSAFAMVMAAEIQVSLNEPVGF